MNVYLSEFAREYTYDQLAYDSTWAQFVEVENRVLYLEDCKRAAERDYKQKAEKENRANQNNFR